ncbi:hypothetical protein PAXRUDRAFT_168983, partial [Paxillus rubicundulus Ve08.2h10]
LRMDRQNWLIWCKKLKVALNELGVCTYISRMRPNMYNKQANAIVKCTIILSIPDSLFLQILNFKSDYEFPGLQILELTVLCHKTLKNLCEMDTFTMELLHETQNTRTTWEAAH